MIHFCRTLDEIKPPALPVSEPPTPASSLPFRRPADYYSSPPEEARPIFPRWVPFGCGSGAIVLLIVVFAIGIAASRGGMGELLELMFASMQGEIDKMFTPEVTAPQKATFDAEMKRLRDSVGANRVSIERLQPLLRTIREVSEDEKVTPAEAVRLTQELRDVNSSAKH